MAFSLTDIQTALTKESVRTTLTGFLTTFGFPVTAWQEEGAARGFLEMASEWGASTSARIVELSRSFYLSTAVDAFLDALVGSHYDETRNAAVRAVFPVSLANGGTVTHGPLAAGTLILRDSNGVTYQNTTSLTLTAGATVPAAVFTAQAAGAAGNAPPGALELATPLAGVTATYDGTITTAGADAESDALLRERALGKWGTLRIEKTADGLLNLIRTAVPNIRGLYVDDQNPRGAGTVDVYVAGETTTAGGADVTAAQAVLDDVIFGNGAASLPLVRVIAAPTGTIDLAATVYVRGVTAAAAQTALEAAWSAWVPTIPVGGFDLSPGPEHAIQIGQIVSVLAAVSGVVSVNVTTPAAEVAVPASRKVIEGTTTFTVVVLS